MFKMVGKLWTGDKALSKGFKDRQISFVFLSRER